MFTHGQVNLTPTKSKRRLSFASPIQRQRKKDTNALHLFIGVVHFGNHPWFILYRCRRTLGTISLPVWNLTYTELTSVLTLRLPLRRRLKHHFYSFRSRSRALVSLMCAVSCYIVRVNCSKGIDCTCTIHLSFCSVDERLICNCQSVRKQPSPIFIFFDDLMATLK